MKLIMGSGVYLETTPMEYAFFMQIQTILGEFNSGKLTNVEAEFKLKFLNMLAKVIGEELAKDQDGALH
ncbi:hypothetical protein [Bacillus infantis]|uniref:hypothetical protein n=1 Tax=Bacillus infantis TaxID=324767 RepID=UPI003219040B